MADQFNFAAAAAAAAAAVPQPAQTFPTQYQYPVASGDQSATPYGYPVQQPGVYGQPQAAPVPSYTYDQATGTYVQSAQQAQMPTSIYAQPAPQAYPAYPTQFPNQYGQIAGVPPVGPPQQAQFPQPVIYNQTQVAPANGPPIPVQPTYGYANPENPNPPPHSGYMNGRGGFGAVSGRGSFQRGGHNKFGGGIGRDGHQSQQYNDPDGIREDTVFISCLPADVTHEALKNQFGSVGKIKDNAKSGMPMIWIFKERGVPKGEALVTYETPQSAQAAVQYFQVRPFNGQKIEVRLATNSQRPEIRPPGGSTGSDGMHGGAMQRGGMGGRGMGSRGTGGGGGRGGGGQNSGSGRDGDWICSGCSNKNFSWRETCNRCQGPRPNGVGGDNMGIQNRGGNGGQRGMSRGGMGQRGAGGSRGGGRGGSSRGGGGPMRGGGSGGSNRPRPSPY